MRPLSASLLHSRLLWGTLGITALLLLIWLPGPQLCIHEMRPLEPLFRRLTLSVGCLFIWFIVQLLPRFYNAWFNSKLLHNLRNSPKPPPCEQQATEALLTQQFNQALMALKKQTFTTQKTHSFWQRFSARYLYQLPWYIIMGAPGAGKTTALLNSGLKFPLTDTLGKQAVRGIGGTRHCDWWFTDSAVLLDTAGRYALQESMHIRDAGEWNTFISLLKRFRARQPINGVIITLSVADLLSDPASVRQAAALSLRQRLQELHQQTGISFPVYIMVTKTDLLKGFISYFSSFDKTQRAKVWGFTFADNPGRENTQSLCADFDEKYQHLIAGLNDRLAFRMAQHNDLTQRAECFLFPQEFATLKPLLAHYIETLFTPKNGAIAWLPRGLFFTSGTQEGLPFDRIMGELSRKLQLPQRQKHSIATWNSVNRAAPIPANREQSFFIRDLLSNVIFKESGLAGSDHGWEYRNRLLHWFGYGALGAGLAFISTLWLVSYIKNQCYLQQVATRIQPLHARQQKLLEKSPENILQLLPFLNDLVRLPKSCAFSLDNPPVSMRAGLYRGNQINDAAMELYQNALQSLLLPWVAQQITDTLRHDNGNDIEFTRKALRAYRMLYQPRNYDGEFLRGWVMQNSQKTLPANVTAHDLQQLDWHLSQLLDRQIQSSPFARDNTLLMHTATKKPAPSDDNALPASLPPTALFPPVTHRQHLLSRGNHD